MPAAISKPRRSKTTRKAHVTEQLSLSGQGRVDREKGIIHGVKIVGTKSPNNHGQPGVTKGTEYPLPVLRAQLHLYEGCNVNLGPHLRKGEEEDPRARFAWLENCEVKEGANPGTFGDLHFLDPSHEMAVRIMNAAEQKPDAFQLSHHAYGEYEVVEGCAVMKEILAVQSVDIVTRGGTVVSLFESEGKGRMAKKLGKKITIKAALLEMVPAEKDRIGKLCEDGGLLAGMDAGPPGTGTAETEGEEDYVEHIGNAIVAVLNDSAMDKDQKKKKILAMLKLTDDADGSEGETNIDEDDEAEPAEGEGDKKFPPEKKEGEGDDKKEKDMKESLERIAKLEAENKDIKDRAKVAKLCESLHLDQPDESLMKIILLQPEKERVKLLERLRPSLTKGPRSRQLGMEVTESAEEIDPQGLLKTCFR